MTDTCTWRGISWALLRDNKKHFWLYGSTAKNEYFRVQVDPSVEHTPIQAVDDIAYDAAVAAYEANK